ncbi:ribosomal-protein-alanine N-acetyltransferase [Pullulanibacillus pueri]|uniref:Alanine acetyltransferase n=1 Tax=Pullulanibacillus pueri TaxID=1437324 RepID=A0A8J2ZYE6_9BACL|nr:GNAT family protein [Pullulanibacillus pueri]MBM7683371.1 ribosomal-protein-alanine N-acetyltransferase [Pullulanibacillus pueri]GGH86572.1 alanine acetyltransferase [Pullulanibacillus pueri]
MIQKHEIDVPTLETERLILRKLTLNDVEDLFAYASKPQVSRYVPWDVHKSIEDSQHFLESITNAYKEKGKLTWAIELKSEGKMIGTIDYVNWSPDHFKAEIAYVLSHHYWGRGMTTEASQKLLEYGFGTLGLNRVEGRIMLENKQSQRVLEKLGMTFEGVARQTLFIKGKFIDIANYALLREEFTPSL